MSDYSPVYSNDIRRFSAVAASAVTGGTLVESAGNSTVQTSGLNSTNVVGIAAHDAGANNRESIWPLPGVVHEITHTAGGSVGDTITSLASGLAASTAAHRLRAAVRRAEKALAQAETTAPFAVGRAGVAPRARSRDGKLSLAGWPADANGH